MHLPHSALRCVGSQAGGRPTLPVILRDKSAVVLYKWEDDVYCSDANSTAFKFPLVDASCLSVRCRPPHPCVGALQYCCCFAYGGTYVRLNWHVIIMAAAQLGVHVTLPSVN